MFIEIESAKGNLFINIQKILEIGTVHILVENVDSDDEYIRHVLSKEDILKIKADIEKHGELINPK